MQVRLLFGYDGPVKMFVDGKAVYTDKNGTNPIVPEQHHLDAVWEKGRHEVMFALALHHGAAWGVSLDIARTDLKRTKRNAEQEEGAEETEEDIAQRHRRGEGAQHGA